MLLFVIVLLAYGTQSISYGQVCSVGDVLSPGESCTYPGTDATFSVLNNGNARWNIPGFPLFNRVSLGGTIRFTATINGKRYHFVATARSGNSWKIVEIGGTVNTVDDPARDSENQPTGIIASTTAPLTAATLNESVVTLTLTGGTYARSRIDIGNALTVSGIAGVKIGTFGPAWFGVDRVSDTKITVELGFTGNIDTDATLTFTVGADAIANYNGPALTAQVSVTAGGESDDTDGQPPDPPPTTTQIPDASDETDEQPPDPPPSTTTETPNQPSGSQSVSVTASPHRARAELNRSVVTLTLSGGTYARSIFDIRGAVTVSGLSGVTVPRYEPDRESDTEITVELGFTGNLDTNAILTFTVGAGAIADYNGPALTAQIPVVTLITQAIQGPWLWMVVPTDSTVGVGISTEIDSLAAASGSALTETHVARNGVNAGNRLGQQRWTSSIVQSKRVCIKYDIFLCPDPTVCWEDNINNVVSTLGMGSGANTNGDTAYALINLYSLHQQSNVLLTVKSGDAIKVWLNGNVVHRDDAENYDCRDIDVPLACDPWVCVSDPAVQESDVHSIAVTLNPGNNLLLVKVRQHGEYWGMNVGLAADFTTTIPTARTDVSVSAPDTVTGDANNDGVVNITDLVLVASNYGQTGQNHADVNADGVVDIKDLTIVASAIDNTAAAPLAQPELLDMFTAAAVKLWLSHAQQLDLTDITVQRGILFLEQLLAALLPRETVLLPNYPNPFNPETWIPYRLAEDAFVTLTIYDNEGRVVRTLEIGHRIAAVYESRSKAIYWDGRNEFGETVASGVYFYQLQTGDYSQLRKMVILK